MKKTYISVLLVLLSQILFCLNIEYYVSYPTYCNDVVLGKATIATFLHILLLFLI